MITPDHQAIKMASDELMAENLLHDQWQRLMPCSTRQSLTEWTVVAWPSGSPPPKKTSLRGAVSASPTNVKTACEARKAPWHVPAWTTRSAECSAFRI